MEIGPLDKKTHLKVGKALQKVVEGLAKENAHRTHDRAQNPLSRRALQKRVNLNEGGGGGVKRVQRDGMCCHEQRTHDAQKVVHGAGQCRGRMCGLQLGLARPQKLAQVSGWIAACLLILGLLFPGERKGGGCTSGVR